MRTIRRYERRGQLPSQLKQPRTYKTRASPFDDDWLWIVSQLKADPALQATTLFGLLNERRPGGYQASQVRPLQRQIAACRAQYGPGRGVMFPQVHERQQAWEIVRDASDRADVRVVALRGSRFGKPGEPALVHPHLFRHARVRQIMRSTKSLPIAQWQAGWSRLQMAYLTVSDDEVRQAMRSVSD